MQDDLVRRPVAMYLYKPSDHEPLDEEGRKWLADQLCSESRVHPDRTMSCGWIPYQAAYEYPALIDTITALRAEVARLRSVFRRLDVGRDAPGHCHDRPGIWDDDNGDKAGTECEWCAQWSAIRALSENHDD